MSLVACEVIGAAALLVGWLGVSGEPASARQTGWLNVGIGGIIIAGVGTAVWLMTGRRAVGQRRRQLLPDILLEPPTDALADLVDPVEDGRGTTFVVLPGMTRYHLASCELVAGKAVKPVPAGRAAAALTPCGVCEPGAVEDAP
jgi:hypothetical protein